MDCSYGGASFGAFLVSLLRVWLESGIPPTLSVVGVRSALSPPLRFSAPVGIRVQPVLRRISVTTIIGQKYLGHILRLRAFSMVVLRTSTRFLCWKSKSWMVAECSRSKRTAAQLRASWTQSRSRTKSSCRFCGATAQRATRSVVDNMEPGGGSK